MKSGIKGFWKKQKNVIRRYKPSSIITHCPVPYIDFSKIDYGFSDNISSGIGPSAEIYTFNADYLRDLLSVEVKE